MGFISQRIQNCRIRVKVLTEMDAHGKVIGVKEVATRGRLLANVCPIKHIPEGKLSAVQAEGSYLTCLPNCFLRSKER